MNVKDKEELERRKMRGLIREAGTQIRKEALKRQTINAKANIEYAKTMQKDVNEDYEFMSKIMKELMGKAQKQIKQGEGLIDIAKDSIIEIIAKRSIVTAFRHPDVIKKHAMDINYFIEDVINKIIKDLSKEGIYLSKFNPIDINGAWPMVVTESKEKMDGCVGILEGIIEASK